MTDITLPQACRRAADFFDAHPDKWIKGAFALDEHANKVHPDDPKAACFCAIGRISKEMGKPNISCLDDKTLREISFAYSDTSLVGYNDDRAADGADVAAYLRIMSDKMEQPA